MSDDEIPVTQKRDGKLLALLDAARELADVADAAPHFRSIALDGLVEAALAWTAEECPICDRRVTTSGRS